MSDLVVNIRTPPQWANTEDEQWRRLERLVRAVYVATGMEYSELTKQRKSRERDRVRGCVFVIAYNLNIHAKVTAVMMQVTRVNAINLARSYRNILSVPSNREDIYTYNIIANEYNKLCFMENEKIKPVFNYCDEQQKESLKMFVSSAFELCPQIVRILKEHGMNVTEKVLCDCVQMRRKEEVVEEVKSINYNLHKSELMPREVVMRVIYTPSNEFLKEWQKIKDRRIKASGAMSPVELKEMTDKIDKECNEIMDAICNVYKGGQAELGRGYLAKIITVDNDGKPCFKTDIDTFCANMASVYVTCTRSLKALDLQRELCKKANELVKLVKPTSLDIRKIFCVNPVNDEVTPSPIDFDLYLKNR